LQANLQTCGLPAIKNNSRIKFGEDKVMANSEHEQRLRDAVQAKDPAADLNGCDLSGIRFSSIRMAGAMLRGADMRGADLSGGYFRGCDLRRLT
jgi:uncharacterized protein YjbI with pentapeptide repeats